MSFAEAVRAITGQAPLHRQTLHGGDLSDVVRVTLSDDHSTCVVKTGPNIAVEARMLEALLAAGAPAPEVLGTKGDVLVLEDLGDGQARGQASDALWGAFGDALHHLHSHTAERFGWEEDYAFGSVNIPGGWSDDWPSFWAEQRLLAAPSALPLDIARRVEALAGRLGEVLPADPPASMLHGDLWNGNLHVSQGRVWMIDPACYHGHAEVDLAMLHLFGAPHPALTRRYGPLEPGYETRRAVYQLWPALVHLRLFGAGYRGMVTQLLDRLGV